MKYDDASWHYGGDFPKDLPIEAGGTHISMYLVWCLLSGLGGELHELDYAEELQLLKKRSMTPNQYFFDTCDGKFADEDLNEEGNAFTKAYFDYDEGAYLSDYDSLLAEGLPTIYHVDNSWENFDQLATIIKSRYDSWKGTQ